MRMIDSKFHISPIRYLMATGLSLLLIIVTPHLYAEELANSPDNSISEDKQVNSNSVSEPKPGSQITDSMETIKVIQETLETLSTEIINSKEKTSLNHESVQTIRDGLELIENKLEEAYSGLDESRSGIAANTEAINKLLKDILSSTRNINTNTSELNIQKSLIEDNSIRLYEILIQISALDQGLKKITEQVEVFEDDDSIKNSIGASINESLNRLWMLLTALMAFFIPLAFATTQKGKNNKHDVDHIQYDQGILLVSVAALVGYTIVGFGIMYGVTQSGIIGTTHHLLDMFSNNSLKNEVAAEIFFLQQIGFILLATLIVYTSIRDKLSGMAHFFLAVLVGAVLIPLYGHWVWASNFIPTNNGWLSGLGFIDQAGSVVINVVAAWFALTLVFKIKTSSSINYRTQKDKLSHDAVYSTSAVMLLWIGCVGLMTGNLTFDDDLVSKVVLNLSLAGIVSASVSFLYFLFFFTNKKQVPYVASGFIAGLVAIMASAHSVTYLEALVIGIVSGILHNIAYRFLRKNVLRYNTQAHVANLLAIHGIVGIWGALSFALFSSEGHFSTPNFFQLGIQGQGVLAAIIYSIVMGNLAAFLFNWRRKKLINNKRIVNSGSS